MDFLGGLLAGIDGQQVVLAEPCCNILLTEVTPAIQLLQILRQRRKLNANAALVRRIAECLLFHSAYDRRPNGFRAVFDTAQLLGDVVPDLGQ